MDLTSMPDDSKKGAARQMAQAAPKRPGFIRLHSFCAGWLQNSQHGFDTDEDSLKV